ncbi:MAG: hypothetical protein N2203_05280 [Bacteroidia bacterium]|nr:hypothetical protein [Bacteroidia bacterium]
MEKKKVVIKLILVSLGIWMSCCTLKKENITIDTNHFNYGIKFNKGEWVYFCSALPDNFQATKSYTMSVQINKDSKDTTFRCSAECYNLNQDVVGKYFIRLVFSISSFRGKGFYDKSKLYIRVDFSEDVISIPVGCADKFDGYFIMNNFDWSEMTGQGTFYFKIFGSFPCSGVSMDTVYFNNGFLTY